MSVDILDVLSPHRPFSFSVPTPPPVTVFLTSRYTLEDGPGDAGTQPYPSASRGGYASQTDWFGGVLFDLFGLASGPDVAQNRSDYRCIYVFNTGTATAVNVKAYLNQLTAGGVLSIGADPRPVSIHDALSTQAVTTSSAYLAPAGVTFSSPTTYLSGVLLGDLPAGYGKAFWLQRTPTASPDAAAESNDLTVQFVGGVLLDRRVTWQTEVAAVNTTPPAPLQPFTYPPSPNPFIHVSADFLSEGGTRVMWDLDSALTDAEPYDFQLQLSQSGGSNSEDWIDVGPSAQDPIYLIDPNSRLWGMSATTNYRVVLTTSQGYYVSSSANVYGVLGQRDWLNVRELIRKERLMQREFVGNFGWLLKAKRYGTRCSCKNPTTGERGNSSCTICYGVGIVGGYHPPIPATFATLDSEGALEHVQYNENLGTTRPVTVNGRVLADVPIVHEDAWVSASGDDSRYYVWSVNEIAAVQGVPVVYNVEFRMAPRSNVLYRVPVIRPANDLRYWKVEETINL